MKLQLQALITISHSFNKDQRFHVLVEEQKKQTGSLDVCFPMICWINLFFFTYIWTQESFSMSKGQLSTLAPKKQNQA